MYTSSSIAKNGQLWNMTGHFSNNQFLLSKLNINDLNKPLKITFELKPTRDVLPGSYTLTIGARYNNEVSYAKVLELEIK